jgi:hypothetical protein
VVPRSSAGLLELEMSGRAGRWGTYGNLECEIPQLLGEVRWGKVFWQVDLPENVAVMRHPAGFSDENRIYWRDGSMRAVAALDEADLERWLVGSVERRGQGPVEQRLLYSRMLSVAPLRIDWVNRPLLVFGSSGLVMLIILVLVAVPRPVKVPVATVVLLGIALGAAVQPHGAIECARSASWGVVLGAVAGASHLLLMRQRSGRPSVFPEPAYLAKSRVGSIRDSSEFVLGPNDSPRDVPDTTNRPRLAAPSSSVRK